MRILVIDPMEPLSDIVREVPNMFDHKQKPYESKKVNMYAFTPKDGDVFVYNEKLGDFIPLTVTTEVSKTNFSAISKFLKVIRDTISNLESLAIRVDTKRSKLFEKEHESP